MQNNDRQNAQTAPQEQGFVGGGYDPVFTWGGFEDHVMAEERVDAAAADPRGGAQPPGGAGAAPASLGGGSKTALGLRSGWTRPQPTLGVVRSPPGTSGRLAPTPETTRSRCTPTMPDRRAPTPEKITSRLL